MNEDRLTNTPKTQLNWIKEVKQEDLEEMELTQTDVLNRSVFTKCVKSFRGFQETKIKENSSGVVG